MLYWLKGCIPVVRRREAMRSVAVTRETILQELEGLPEDQLREVLEFILSRSYAVGSVLLPMRRMGLSS
jgi:hypothetical protein